MCASWNNRYRPDLLASFFEKIKNYDKAAGTVSFRGFEYENYLAVLCSIVNFNQDMPEIERHGIINAGVFAAARKGEITGKSLLKEISSQEKAYLNKKVTPFVLLTTLGILNHAKVPNTKIGSASITFSRNLPSRFAKARKDIETRALRLSFIKGIPSNYLFVRVHVKGRTVHEAANRALDEFDLLRGIFNLGLNMGTTFRISSGKRRPVNQILLGPIHTLHDSFGKPSTERFWYEPEFDGSFTPYDWGKTADQMKKFVKNVRRKLKRCRYNDSVADGIVRYTRALDNKDLAAAFLKLWGVLEMLTDTLRENYDRTIKRTMFLFRERDYHFQVLNHLRDNRNKSVHTGSDSTEAETLVYQLKSYVEALLVFHLDEGQRFITIGEAAEFLDLPAEKTLLEKRLALYKQAVKFIS